MCIVHTDFFLTKILGSTAKKCLNNTNHLALPTEANEDLFAKQISVIKK